MADFAAQQVDETKRRKVLRSFESLGMVQPFKQAHREVYLVIDAERRTERYSNRFAAHILRQHQFNALCGARHWKNKLRLMVDDEYPPARRELAPWGIRAEFWIEDRQRSCMVGRRTRDPYGEYWQNYSFGELSATARAFAGAWPEKEFVQQAIAQLPWGHQTRLLDRIKDRPTREWYRELIQYRDGGASGDSWRLSSWRWHRASPSWWVRTPWSLKTGHST